MNKMGKVTRKIDATKCIQLICMKLTNEKWRICSSLHSPLHSLYNIPDLSKFYCPVLGQEQFLNKLRDL